MGRWRRYINEGAARWTLRVKPALSTTPLVAGVAALQPRAASARQRHAIEPRVREPLGELLRRHWPVKIVPSICISR